MFSKADMPAFPYNTSLCFVTGLISKWLTARLWGENKQTQSPQISEQVQIGGKLWFIECLLYIGKSGILQARYFYPHPLCLNILFVAFCLGAAFVLCLILFSCLYPNPYDAQALVSCLSPFSGCGYNNCCI